MSTQMTATVPAARVEAEWTDEKAARLRALWASTAPTADVAAELGVSLAAACGKAHRMGLPHRPQKKQTSNWSKQTHKAVGGIHPHHVKSLASEHQGSAPEVLQTRLDMVKRHSRKVTLRARGLVTCTWSGCSAPPVAVGKPYCTLHSRRP